MTFDLKDILSPQECACEHFASTGESARKGNRVKSRVGSKRGLYGRLREGFTFSFLICLCFFPFEE